MDVTIYEETIDFMFTYACIFHPCMDKVFPSARMLILLSHPVFFIAIVAAFVC